VRKLSKGRSVELANLKFLAIIALTAVMLSSAHPTAGTMPVTPLDDKASRWFQAEFEGILRTDLNDTTPPIIVGAKIFPLVLKRGDPRAEVSAVVTDTGGVATVYAETDGRVMLMVDLDGDHRYTGYIGSNLAGGIKNIVIVAVDRSGNVARRSGGTIMVLDPWDLNANGIEDSLERLGSEETRVIVLHDKNATNGLYAMGSDQRSLGLMTGSSMVIQGDKIADLSKLNGVKGIYRDQKLKVLAEPGDSSYSPRKATQSIGILNGQGVTVALLDTGADAGHASLDDMDDDPSTDDPKIIAFKDFVNGQTVPYDDQGHGTHCASLIAGTRGIGVAPGAKLVVVKVMDRDGACYLSDAMTALEWCLENRNRYGINIISFSVGGETPVDGTSLLDEACNRMVDEGLTVVVAAGNSGPGPQSIVIPGSAKNVITVGAIDEEGNIFDRSSRGPTLDGRVKPDLVTLGVDVMSALAGSVDRESSMTGTSMAVPQVSGSIAVLLQAHGDLTPADVKRILVSTSDDLGTPGPDNIFGNGALNLSRSLSMIQYKPNILAGPELESLSLSRERAEVGDPVVIEAQVSGDIEGIYTRIEGPDDQIEMPMVDFDSNGIYTAWWETRSWSPGDYTVEVELEGKFGERRSRAVPFHLDPKG